jgi:hypothetical protein
MICFWWCISNRTQTLLENCRYRLRRLSRMCLFHYYNMMSLERSKRSAVIAPWPLACPRDTPSLPESVWATVLCFFAIVGGQNRSRIGKRTLNFRQHCSHSLYIDSVKLYVTGRQRGLHEREKLISAWFQFDIMLHCHSEVRKPTNAYYIPAQHTRQVSSVGFFSVAARYGSRVTVDCERHGMCCRREYCFEIM